MKTVSNRTMLTAHGNNSKASTMLKANKKAPSPAALRKASTDYAGKVMDKMFRNSQVKDLTSHFPQFISNEIEMGKVLGKGGFGTVKEIRGFRVKNDGEQRHKNADDEKLTGDFESRKFIAEHCTRPQTGDARYAIKYLSPEVIQDPALYFQGIYDMAVETRFLSSIQHPNIIKLRAFGSGKSRKATALERSTSDEQQQSFLLPSLGEDYFIVLDRLYETLEKRIDKWGRKLKLTSSSLGKMFADRKQKKLSKITEERILVAFDLCAAVEYLHQRRIIYRDLKPENIGFDIRGDVKLFDFGLAKELTRDVKRYANGTYQLTECTGTLRYMAPEVYQGKPYNEKCDVYSMGILLWEIMSCKVPFQDYSPKTLKSQVLQGERRPPIDVKKRPYNDWPSSIVGLLHRAWGTSVEYRPSICEFKKVLRKELINLRGGDTTGLEHTRRRSTFVSPSNNFMTKSNFQLLKDLDEEDEEEESITQASERHEEMCI